MYSKMDSPKLSVLEQESMTRKQNDPDTSRHEHNHERRTKRKGKKRSCRGSEGKGGARGGAGDGVCSRSQRHVGM